MQTIGRVVLGASTAAAVGILAACADSPLAPKATKINLAPTSFVLLAQPTNNDAGSNTITVCSDVAGATFSVSFAGSDVAWEKKPPLVDPDANPGGPYTLTVAAGAGNCATIWLKPGVGAGADAPSTATVVQTAAAAGYQFKMVEVGGNLTNTANNGTKTATLQANAYHGATATFTQELIPVVVPDVCDFSTFGGFVLENNYNISYGGNAGRVKDGFAYGDLQFTNHTTGDKVHVWNVTGYGHPASGPLSSYPDSRYAIGMGTINEAGSFPVEFRFVDLGEPGTSDRVWLKVNNAVWIQEQVVQGGNIQLHNVCKKAPFDEKH
jgi:hypothetical protein